eukprot:1428960-Rhodomonas_salina.1
MQYCSNVCFRGDREQGPALQTLLAHLDLSFNQIGDEGAGRRAEVLGECKALAHLDLRGNQIGDEGAGRLAE